MNIRNASPQVVSLQAVVLLFALVFFGCHEEPLNPPQSTCPAGTSFDSELGRCVLDQDSENSVTPDAGGSDAGEPTDVEQPGHLDVDSGPSGGADTGSPSEPDTGPDPCDGVTCGANATCHDGECSCTAGYEGDPYQECLVPPPCDGECPFGATCLDDQCICDPGFSTVADGCQIETVSDPATRSQDEVCQRWTDTPWTLTTDKWAQPPEDECDLGWLSEEYHLEAIREATRYRWLVGLPAVTTSQNARHATQACATTLAAENAGLTHNIPTSYACYTPEAAAGAGSSNISSGAVSSADTIRRYVYDGNTPSLGHRRWVFNPSMTTTGFGIRNGYACQHAFDFSGNFQPEFTAYPAPGYFPHAALHGKWSVASRNVSLSGSTEVIVERLPDEEEVGTHDFRYHSSSTVRPGMISWSLTSAPQPGDSYRITIVDAYGEDDPLVYETHLVSCN